MITYREPLVFLDLDSARQSQIEALRSERRSPSPRGKGEKEGRFGKVAASPNSKKLTVRGINVFNRQKDLSLDKSSIRALVRATLSHLKVSCDEVSIYFVTEKKICQLHDQFFQDPTPTDCISFPLDDKHLGEVFVCPATALAYAKKRNIDPYHETILYMVHGLLHLIGYDDLEEKARKVMRRKERSCMNHLNLANLL